MINVIIMRKRRVMPYDKCDHNEEEEGDALMINVIIMRKRRVMPYDKCDNNAKEEGDAL